MRDGNDLPLKNPRVCGNRDCELNQILVFADGHMDFMIRDDLKSISILSLAFAEDGDEFGSIGQFSYSKQKHDLIGPIQIQPFKLRNSIWLRA